MPPVAPGDFRSSEEVANSQILLELLESVERDGAKTQRHLATELGIAVGLVNAYLKRCVKKGLVKVRHAPARRYAYYLTPQGFAEKSRLTAEYLSYSFSFFRQAKADCARVFETARVRGFQRLALAGRSDLAEIAALSATESGARIVAVVDREATEDRFIGVPLVNSYDRVPEPFDAVVITALNQTSDVCQQALDRFGIERVLLPEILRTRMWALQRETS